MARMINGTSHHTKYIDTMSPIEKEPAFAEDMKTVKSMVKLRVDKTAFIFLTSG
jgi:hypothetical protein